MPDTTSLLSYVVPLCATLLIIVGMAGMLHKNRRLQFVSTTALLAVIGMVSLYMFLNGLSAIIMDSLAVYQFSMFFVLLFSTALILVNLLSYGHSNDYLSFSMLMGFVAAGMFTVAMAYSLIAILLGIELMSLPTAFMILINGKHHVEAAMKLFVLAAISIAMIAFAIALIFPYSPSLLLTSNLVNSGMKGGYLIVLSMLLFVSGLSFDASLFPFNLWIPDVYQGAPGNITALLAGVNKKVAFVALFEVLFVVMLPYSPQFSVLFEILAVVTMFFGNMAALVQENVKRLFAYSAISQAGYIAIGFAAASQYGSEASIYQIAAHTFMIIGAFAVVLWLEEKNIKDLKDYNGLATSNGFAAFTLTIFMLSMIGIPPLMGFIGKFLLFTSAISAGEIILVVIAIVNSFISVYYYGKVIFAMYAKRPREQMSMDWTVATVAIICMLFVLLLGAYPQPFINAASIAAGSLSVL